MTYIYVTDLCNCDIVLGEVQAEAEEIVDDYNTAVENDKI